MGLADMGRETSRRLPSFGHLTLLSPSHHPKVRKGKGRCSTVPAGPDTIGMGKSQGWVKRDEGNGARRNGSKVRPSYEQDNRIATWLRDDIPPNRNECISVSLPVLPLSSPEILESISLSRIRTRCRTDRSVASLPLVNLANSSLRRKPDCLIRVIFINWPSVALFSRSPF